MPGYKKNNRRKKNYRKKRAPWYRKKYSALTLGVKALRGVNKIRKLINVEQKAHDQVGVFALTSSSYVGPLAEIAQGDAHHLRDGNSILLQGLYVRYTLDDNGAATGTKHVRTLIVKDNQQISDTRPTLDDVLRNADVWSPLDDDTNAGRFSILYDDVYTVGTATWNPGKFFKTYIPINCHVKYNGTASTDIQKNGIYIMMVSNDATGSVSVSYHARLRFTDN